MSDIGEHVFIADLMRDFGFIALPDTEDGPGGFGRPLGLFSFTMGAAEPPMTEGDWVLCMWKYNTSTPSPAFEEDGALMYRHHGSLGSCLAAAARWEVDVIDAIRDIMRTTS